MSIPVVFDSIFSRVTHIRLHSMKKLLEMVGV